MLLVCNSGVEPKKNITGNNIFYSAITALPCYKTDICKPKNCRGY